MTTTRTAPRIKPALALLTATGIALGGVLLVAPPAQAAVIGIVVTTTADDSAVTPAGSLRAAAESMVAGNTYVITFDPTVFNQDATPEVIELEEEIRFPYGTSIIGPGSTKLTIARAPGLGSAIRQFDLLPAVPSQDYALSGLTFAGGAAGSSGIAIYSSFSVEDELARNITLDDVTVRDQEAGYGAGLNIYQVGGNLSISNSLFTGNTASSGVGGALSIDSLDGNISITNTVFAFNGALTDGGAVYVTDMQPTRTLAVSASNFEENTAAFGGGLAATGVNGPVTLNSSVFEANEASDEGGAVWISSVDSLAVTTSSFIGNSSDGDGGALYLNDIGDVGDNPVGGTRLETSTFADNLAGSEGSSIFVPDLDGVAFTMNNTTVDDSDPDSDYAVFFEDIGDVLPGSVGISHSTIYGNGAVGVGDHDSGSVILSHNILASVNPQMLALNIGNPAAFQADLEWNLLSSGTQPFYNSIEGNTFNVSNMGLGALADNGGPTLTRLPSQTSPAHEGGDPNLAAAGLFDQRGTPFVRRVQRIDIGAVEIQAVLLPATGPVNTALAPLGGALLLLGAALVIVRTREKSETARG